MPAIPFIYQQYPPVPLSDLSDAYSFEGLKINTSKAAIVSYLPKCLKVGNDAPFENRYVLFIEDTANVDTITWKCRLHDNGLWVEDSNYVITGPGDANEFSIYFQDNLLEADMSMKYDRLRIDCTVVQGRHRADLTIQHDLVRMMDVREIGLDSGSQSKPVTGHPGASNYIINHLKEYLSPEAITWNNVLIDPLLGEMTLLKIVSAIVYQKLVTGDPTALPLYNELLFDDPAIRSHLNDNTAYTGIYLSGLCQLPLYLLGDILDLVTALPGFLIIDKTKPVYGMIASDPAKPVSTAKEEYLRALPQKVIDSRNRLAADKTKFAQLYMMSLFPKSSIKLSAILVRYLFEASKANECRDCYARTVVSSVWKFLSFENLKDHPDFLKNILTHYFNGPANIITSFASKALQTTPLVWGPVIYTLLTLKPRIIRAYFARKVVKEVEAGEYSFEFERLDSTMRVPAVDDESVEALKQWTFDSSPGKQVFLVVDTLYAPRKEVLCNVFPLENFLTGNQDNLELRIPGGAETDLRKTLENFDALHRTAGGLPGTARTSSQLKADHRHRAIIKLTLAPADWAAIHTWSEGAGTITGLRGNEGNLALKVKFSDDADMYAGNDTRTFVKKAEFLNANDKFDSGARFRIRNSVVYEIFHENNEFKLFTHAAPPVLITRLGVINNRFVEDIENSTADSPHKFASYYYHDRFGTEHHVCDTLMLKSRPKRREPWNNSIVTGAALVPAHVNYLPNRQAGEEIDAIDMYFYENGTKVEGRSDSYTNNVANKFNWYMNTNQNFTEKLAHADILEDPYMGANATPALHYHRWNVRIRFDFDNTRRRYARPDLFAALLAALARTYERNSALTLVCQGFAYPDGSCFPSAEHVDGKAMDTDYFAPADTQIFINDLHDLGFRLFRVGVGMVYNHGTPDVSGTLHTGHLHSTNFQTATVQEINPA